MRIFSHFKTWNVSILPQKQTKTVFYLYYIYKQYILCNRTFQIPINIYIFFFLIYVFTDFFLLILNLHLNI